MRFDEDQSPVAPADMIPVVATPHLQIFASIDSIPLGRNPRSVLLGKAYHQDDAFTPVSRVTAQSLPIGGRSLEECVWGDFLCASETENEVYLYRSALGRLPCYYVVQGTWLIFASDIRRLGLALAHPSGRRWTKDWEAVAQFALFPHIRTQRTCIADIRELLGGQSLTFVAHDAKHHTEWDPWAIGHLPPPTYEEAIRLIRSAVFRTVRRISEDHSHGLLGASGGLDSSIVAAALANTGRDVSLVTLTTPDPRGDESDFAGLLASRLKMPLFKCAERIEHVDLFRSSASHLPRPVARSFTQSSEHFLMDIASSEGADYFLSGGGGDNVFCSLQSATPIADLLLQGRLFAALRCALDISTITGSGVSKALRLGIYRAVRPGPAYRWPSDTRYLTPRAIERARAMEKHPWIKADSGLPPGRAAHIASLPGNENHLEGYMQQDRIPSYAPLMSKPVVEAALRIPSWMWCRGGRNRAVAREAFADLLPREIIQRRSKGTPDGFVAEIFHHNHRAIEPFLCDGHLAQNDVIDASAVAAYLRASRPGNDRDIDRILSLCDVEAWSRSL